MDRRLVVMRHAQARPADTGEGDHERRLTDPGRRDARRIADRLVELSWAPERVVCSDAARTVETWSRMVERLPRVAAVVTTPELYGAGMEELAAVVAEQPDEAGSLLVLGHNPGWEEIVATLSGEHVALGTSNAALLARTGAPGWREALEPGSWRLVDLLRPKEPVA